MYFWMSTVMLPRPVFFHFAQRIYSEGYLSTIGDLVIFLTYIFLFLECPLVLVGVRLNLTVFGSLPLTAILGLWVN